jgi:hypothetical protein
VKAVLPEVLRAGALFSPGASGLPPSLERVVPEDLRYWETADPVDARVRHVRLLKSGFFTPENVRLVDGIPQKVVLSLYQPAPDARASEDVRKAVKAVWGRELPVCKMVEEERYFTAVVLQPTTSGQRDLQKQWYTAKEIRKAMIRFMAYCLSGEGGIGLQHHGGLVNDRVMLVENFQAPCDFTTDGGIDVRKDAWLQSYHARDVETWDYVKKHVRGVSIQGRAELIPG